MRAQRIHHTARLKEKRASYWGGAAGKRPGLVVNTPTPCSCWMCGNPRKHFNEQSIQERSSDELLRCTQQA